MAQPKYKLTYLDGKGRAEVMRFVFAYRNIPYEDVRIPYGPEWNKVKNDFPWGEVPVLEIDGKVLAQSGAILRFLGKKHDLAGDNEYESAKCDEMWESLSDLQTPTWTMYMEPDDSAKKKELTTKLLDETVPKYCGKWNEILEKNGGYFVGKRLSYADIAIASAINYHIEKLGASVFEKYPALMAHHDKVHNEPGIKEWVAKRPTSPW